MLVHRRSSIPVPARRRSLATLLAMLAGLAGLIVLPAAPASAVGTIYYVDNSSAACSAAAHASTPELPYCGIGDLNGRQMQPGDQILIRSGTSYDRSMATLSGSGTAADPIRIGAYGPGPKPHLSLSYFMPFVRAGLPIIKLQNPSFWRVSGLEFSHAAAGVVAQYSSAFGSNYTGNRSLEFTDLLLHHIAGIALGRTMGGVKPYSYMCDAGHYLDMWNSSGISITGRYGDVVPTTTSYLDGVVFRDIEGHNNFNTISVDSCDAKVGDPEHINDSPQPHLVRNVLVDNVRSYDSDGAGYAYQCGEGVRFGGVTGLTVMNSRLLNHADCYVPSGAAAVILVSVTDVTFVNNTITDVPRTESGDATAIDHELFVRDVRLFNNLFARNAGPGVEYLAIRCGIHDYNDQHLVDGNSFYGNHSSAFRMKQTSGCPTSPPARPFSGTFSNNLTADPHMLTGNGEGFESWSLIGNSTVAPGEVPHYAADEFGALQGGSGWTYEVTRNRNDARQWYDATYVDEVHGSGAWYGGGGTGYLARFEQTGGACSSCASARVWTAPRNGFVTVRSRALQARGTRSAWVQVQQNGASLTAPVEILPGAIPGKEVNLEVQVQAGDQLRFVEWNDPAAPDDWVSWSPSIAYVDPVGASETGDFADPEFETKQLGSPYTYAPNLHAWTFSNTSTQLAGIVRRGSDFGNPDGQGNQAAFLQRQGWIEQKVSNVPGGDYRVGFDLARRAAGASQTLQLIVDGEIKSTASTTSNGYVRFQTRVFTLEASAQPHTIRLQGLATSDATAFVDQIHLEPVNEVYRPWNGGFEVPLLSIGESRSCPTDSGWGCYSGGAGRDNAGVAAIGGFWKVDGNPEGNQVAYFSESGPNSTGAISQTAPELAAGSYSVTFTAAQREYYESYGRGQQLKVSLTAGGSTVTTYVWPRNGKFQEFATPPIKVPAGGDLTIRFEATQNSGTDAASSRRWTAFLDDVRVVPATALAPTDDGHFVNGSFEAAPLAASTYAYGSSAPGWQFQRSLSNGGAGIASNGSAFGPQSTWGSQAALVQRDAAIVSTDDWLDDNATYAITLSARQRVRSGVADLQDLRIQVDGVPYVWGWRPGSEWENRTFVVTVPPGATGRLEIVGTHAGDDHTAFVDNIQVARLY